MKKIKLDQEEKELLESFEAGEWKSAPNLAKEKALAKKAATQHFAKDMRINIRLSSHDLNHIKQKHPMRGYPIKPLLPAFYISMRRGICTHKTSYVFRED
jgi:predicted DNA binding CopG/RHH family protein